jgi:PAS domain S-box-containing protein
VTDVLAAAVAGVVPAVVAVGPAAVVDPPPLQADAAIVATRRSPRARLPMSIRPSMPGRDVPRVSAPVGGPLVPIGAYDPERYASLGGYADDVVQIVRELDLHDVFFVGHSVGSMIGALAAIEEPDRFGALVMIGPSPRYLDDDGYVGGFSATPAGDAFYGALLEDDAEELYQQPPCAYVSTLPDGTIAKINATFTSWTGHDRNDVVGRRRLQDLFTPGGRIYCETHLAPLLRMQGLVREIATEILCADGSRLPVLMNAVGKLTEGGVPIAYRVAFFDATERRSYERELVARRRAEDSEARDRARHLGGLWSATSRERVLPQHRSRPWLATRSGPRRTARRIRTPSSTRSTTPSGGPMRTGTAPPRFSAWSPAAAGWMLSCRSAATRLRCCSERAPYRASGGPALRLGCSRTRRSTTSG